MTYAGYISMMSLAFKEATSENPTVLHIRFCSLSNNFNVIASIQFRSEN